MAQSTRTLRVVMNLLAIVQTFSVNGYYGDVMAIFIKLGRMFDTTVLVFDLQV